MTYKVFVRSTPGFYEQYATTVLVNAENEEEAEDRAYRQLHMTDFPDRGRSMWKTERIECVGR